jgi:riboflavin kinase / FMN adenylyltransferase
LESVVLPDKPLHLAIGMFDGVHLGHQAVIETAVNSAHQSKGVCGVLTFWPHPSKLFQPDNPVDMIMTPETKAEVLAMHDIDCIIQQPFDARFASIEADDFVKYLKRCLPHLSSIHVGSGQGMFPCWFDLVEKLASILLMSRGFFMTANR